MPLIINGQSVEDGIVEGEFAEIKAYFERLGNISCCERDPEFRGYARENIIARVLLAQEAQRAIAPVAEADVDAALAKLQEAHGGESGFYAAIGGTPEQLAAVRRNVEGDLRVRKMIEDRCEEEPTPDEESLRRYYDEHIALFMTAEEVRASHILKAPKRGENRAGAYDSLRPVRQQLLAGADFDGLARVHSEKADEHIDLGFFKRGELPEEFEVVAFSMNVGEVSPVFGSSYGYHLIKVTDHKPSVPKPFEAVREEVLQAQRTKLGSESPARSSSPLRPKPRLKTRRQLSKHRSMRTRRRLGRPLYFGATHAL